MKRRPRRSTLFPYTTLLRSHARISGPPLKPFPKPLTELTVKILSVKSFNLLFQRRSATLRKAGGGGAQPLPADRKSTRLNSSHANISYAVFCLKKKNYLILP